MSELRRVTPQAGRWSDVSGTDLVVWVEQEGVVLYEGERETARRRRVLTVAQAQSLSIYLETAAKRVHELQHEARDR